MKSYVSAYPHFNQKQISQILKNTHSMLKGELKLSMGESVREFENKFAHYCGVQFAIATSSCTCALDVVFKALGLGANDEVIVPTQTFFANASSVLFNGIKLRLVDTNKDFMLTQKILENSITPSTKAIVIVHFSGLISPDIFAIAKMCRQKRITLIEDCSHAHGALASQKNTTYKAGSIGDIGVFSFYSTKILTTGEGGMIVSNDKKFASLCRAIANRGLRGDTKEEQFIALGSNYRMAEFNAILGLSGLEFLESSLVFRQKLALAYKKQLKTLEKRQILSFQEIPEGFRHSFWRLIMFLHKHNTDEILHMLKKHNIYADAPYVPLLHKQPFLQKHHLVSYAPNDKPTPQNHISLPLHGGITLKDVKFISTKLKEVLV